MQKQAEIEVFKAETANRLKDRKQKDLDSLVFKWACLECSKSLSSEELSQLREEG